MLELSNRNILICHLEKTTYIKELKENNLKVVRTKNGDKNICKQILKRHFCLDKKKDISSRKGCRILCVKKVNCLQDLLYRFFLLYRLFRSELSSFCFLITRFLDISPNCFFCVVTMLKSPDC